MTARKLAVLSAGAALAAVFVLAGNPGELARRADFLARSASMDLAVRRANGSGAAFDREFFVFLEALSQRLPRDVPGVAVYVPNATTEALHLAAYELAPVPVRMSPEEVPPRWLAAVYRLPPLEGWRIVAQLPGGALLAPP